MYDAVRNAVIRLIRSREIRPDSSAAPVYFVLYDLENEDRARANSPPHCTRRCTATSAHWPRPYPTPRP
ncbi:hypothetical protein GCM10014715_89280 [Streptomyces spiralis]|uniref:Uncharacterized protein n=1 Tax=Streptomyces spiralis TaxID=66376 RepID=A0A919E7U6_9ACTN|nr:hypothetical protein [Streptomyces spiralis]GHF21232.1 hypothetical protein GCM10014715_89280 [Streptomyces spiralis]